MTTLIVKRPPVCCVCGKSAADSPEPVVFGWVAILYPDGSREEYCPEHPPEPEKAP